MTQTSSSNKEIFKKACDVIRKAWYCTDDEDAEATNELMCDLFNEIDDFLRDYSMDMGN